MASGFLASFDQGCNRLQPAGPVLAKGHAGEAGAHAAAVIGEAWHRWGIAVPCHVAGEYAFAIHDRATATLCIGHDLLGIVPVFHACRDSAVIFGTDIAEVAAAAGAERLDLAGLAETIMFGAPHGTRTAYAGVSRLAPGTSLWIDGNGVRTVAHLPKFIAAITVEPRAAGTDAAAFRSALDSAIATATSGATSVAAELSGGLDSSTIICAAAAAGHAVHAVSLEYAGVAGADETRFMAAVVDQHQLAWTRIDGSAAAPFMVMPGVHPEPATMSVGAGVHALVDARLGAIGASILLSGVGGDQLCYGDSPEPHYLADLAGQGRWAALARQLHIWQTADPHKRSIGYWLRRHVAQPLADYRHGRLLGDDEPVTIPPWLVMRPGQIGAASPPFPRLSRQISGQAYWERLLAGAAIATRLKQYRCGIDMRFPLLSLPLVRFMAGRPAAGEFGPQDDRRLQRLAMAGIMPEIVRTRQSKGGGGALYYSVLRDNPQLVADLSGSSLLVAMGLVDGRQWRFAVERACFGHTHNLGQFISTVAVEFWLRTLPHAMLLPDQLRK